MTDAAFLDIDGERLRVSRLEKVLYPAAGFAKSDVIAYYLRIAEAMLPHLQGRAVTLRRFPDAVTGESFFEKRCPSHRPKWIATVEVPQGKHIVAYCRLDRPAALAWVANLASLELHVPLSRGEESDRPTALVFDLDPGPPAGIREACRLGLRLKEMLEGLALQSFAKTSGGKGLHVYLPLNTPTNFAATKQFAHAVARLLAQEQPERVTAVMSKSQRSGRVFVDWSQNDATKTTLCVYSLRAQERPTVSTPVAWEEVQAASQSKAAPLSFEAADVLDRVRDLGDLFAPVLELRQRLPGLGLAKAA